MSDWKDDWNGVIAAIGTDFGGPPLTGADQVERGLIRRYLEPLEFDCPLHQDDEVARAQGFEGITAPVSSIASFTIAPLWEPGGPPVFTSAERDAQPANYLAHPRNKWLTPGPPTTGYFATEIEIEYFAPVYVGDRLTNRGRRLLSCTPKETSVGRGAFTTWESEIINQRGELVARTRNGLYSYNPHNLDGEG